MLEENEKLELLFKDALSTKNKNDSEYVNAKLKLSASLFEADIMKKFLQENVSKEIFENWVKQNKTISYAKNEIVEEIYNAIINF